MSQIAHLASAIFKKVDKNGRCLVAVAGPPGAGKSTISSALIDLLPEGSAVVVPMDGFHYDDAVLDQKGLRSRKGAPETFDFAGFEHLLKRIRAGEPEIAIPVFDRNMELSRAAAAIIDTDKRFIIVEGNYLLLSEKPWVRLRELFDFTVFLDVPRDELERRLIQRWRDHGRSEEDGRAWVDSNDLPNVDRVLQNRSAADLTI
ncbi:MULTISPECIES: nucleoside triphosphate hydrolase [Mesorhizobium]|uniref:Nucleoside triphosphate hydrolase n=1 Tax=Mesorhizobium denitrificans TaxID=2294114 RepID=A0A371XJ25_9HYPH|nr:MULTISPECIES: nucleoside triphosphate hydrolase [Mesorhizobium]RFC69210.1 nucleoside triphosphate hydrolase [Mesorhizobium denitrificans]